MSVLEAHRRLRGKDHSGVPVGEQRTPSSPRGEGGGGRRRELTGPEEDGLRLCRLRQQTRYTQAGSKSDPRAQHPSGGPDSQRLLSAVFSPTCRPARPPRRRRRLCLAFPHSGARSLPRSRGTDSSQALRSQHRRQKQSSKGAAHSILQPGSGPGSWPGAAPTAPRTEAGPHPGRSSAA